MRRLTTLAAATLLCLAASAQTHVKPFSHYDLGISAGTTGIGLELNTPISRSWGVRAGFDFMPHFEYDMDFTVTVGDGDDVAEGARRFQKMASTLQDLTGYKVDDNVVMEGVPKMYNFKLLVDFKPLRNKHWHVTAGFYWGNSKIATAENAKADMTSLFAVGLYNHMYEVAVNDEPYMTVDGADVYLPSNISQKLIDNGRMGVHVGTYKHDIAYKEDVMYTEGEIDADGNIHHDTEVKYHAGVDIEHHKGDAYNMEPDENSMVSAKMKVNRFKPYLGVGYMGSLSKRDPRWQIGFDAGVLFWGGTPSLKTHDGTDLINDVDNLRHSVDRYVKIIKAAKVMPVANLRISYSLEKRK